MSGYLIYGQKVVDSKDSELCAVVNSLDLAKLIEGYYQSQFLNCSIKEFEKRKTVEFDEAIGELSLGPVLTDEEI